MKLRGSKRFGSARDGRPWVFHELDLGIRAGEFFTIVGPSGCGKSTILRCIAGLETLTEGSIEIDGIMSSGADIQRPPEQRNVAMVFQSYAIWPHMSVAENAGFALRYGRSGLRKRKSERKEAVASTLEQFGLAPYSSDMPQVLSGGQEQRLALARAFLTKPSVLLLDEPLSNLDAQLRIDMRRQLREFHRDTKITIVYITHDRAEALSLSDRIAVMSPRGLEQVGSPRDVYDAPSTEFVANFIGNANTVAGSVVALGDGGHVVIESGVGQVRGVGDGSLAVGDAVWWSCYPERVSLVDPGVNTRHNGQDNVASGVVKHVDYMGDRNEIVVDVDGLDISMNAVAGWAKPVNSQVTVRFDPNGVRVFRRTPSPGIE